MGVERDFAMVLAALYAREINYGMQSFWDGGVDVWIGDELNGRRAQANINGRDPDSLARWLREAAWVLYPAGDFPWPQGTPVIFRPEDAQPTPPRAILRPVSDEAPK